METLLESKTGNAIASVAIGDVYYDLWRTYAFPSWKKYCEKYGLGLFVMREYAHPEQKKYVKRPTWEKFLVLSEIEKRHSDIDNVCYIDTDFLISPIARNVFEHYHDKNKIALVSAFKNMPYPDTEVRRRIAFFRNRYYSKDYPLDSALFISLKDVAAYHGTPELENYACAGFFVGNIQNHARLFEEWYYKYTKDVQSITDGGDQHYFNCETQSFGQICWLDYGFQALWTHEVAWKYPFLYKYGNTDKALVTKCIEASLLVNDFLHFAGSWHESKMWTETHAFADPEVTQSYADFARYCEMPVTGKPVGSKKP